MFTTLTVDELIRLLCKAPRDAQIKLTVSGLGSQASQVPADSFQVIDNTVYLSGVPRTK